MGPPLPSVRRIFHQIYINLYPFNSLLLISSAHHSIQTHPSLDFTVVINPASGPGASALPDANYTREITRLNTFSNVRTIGYVAVDYGKRALDAAYADIAVYAQWRTKNPGLAMQGIFLDESPQLADDHNTTFLADVKTRIKATTGLASGSIGKIPFVG
jgi:hypothetical protein